MEISIQNLQGWPINFKLITCKVYIFSIAISTCLPEVRNHGDSPHFLWGKICSVVLAEDVGSHNLTDQKDRFLKVKDPKTGNQILPTLLTYLLSAKNLQDRPGISLWRRINRKTLQKLYERRMEQKKSIPFDNFHINLSIEKITQGLPNAHKL